MINAGNSEEAIKALNCNVDTNDNILQVITKNLCDSISNKQIELEAENKKIYPPNLNKDKEYKIKMIENNLNKLKEKYDDVKKKIYDLNQDFCPVCMDSFTNPVIVNCCKNCFCFDCLAVSMGELHNNKCPFCTQKISKSDIHLISSDPKLKDLTKIPNKTNKTDLKDKLDQSYATNKSMQNYVNFLKNSYSSMFNDNTLFNATSNPFSSNNSDSNFMTKTGSTNFF